MGRIEKNLVRLAVFSCVVIAFPEIGIYLLITVIGIPLAVAYWATPAIFVVSGIAYLLHRGLHMKGLAGGVVSLIATAGLLAIPPYILNGPIHRKAATLAAGDLDNLQAPLKARVMASREGYRSANRDTSPCTGFCLHALLSGTAERFLVAHTNAPFGDVVRDDGAIAFWLERRDVCPPVSLKSGNRSLYFAPAKGDGPRSADPVETMKLRASNGECLVSEPATLGDADIVISRGKITERAFLPRSTGFGPTNDAVVAHRVGVHQKTPDNQFEEIYRRTEVKYLAFGWLQLPSVNSEGSLDVVMGWWRIDGNVNGTSEHQKPYEWSEFLTGKLGLKLKLDNEGTTKKTLDKLRKMLDEDTPPSPADLALFKHHFDNIGAGGIIKTGPDEFELGLRMLANNNYPAPPNTANLVRYAARNAGDAEMARLAHLLVRRLIEGARHPQVPGERSASQIGNLAVGVRVLPDAALLPHQEAMLALAARPDVQRHGEVMLPRLAVYGDAAVPTLLRLMKAGLEGGKHFYRESQFQHPYVGGLRALCLAGERAQSALPDLRELSTAGVLPDHAGYGGLLFTTLLRLGEDREQVRTLFVAAAKNEEYASDKRFNRLVASARKKKPRCTF